MMHRLEAIWCICFANVMLLHFVPQWCDVCPSMCPQARIIRRSRHHWALPNIICRRQTSFKKRTFVLVDKSTFFVGARNGTWTRTVNHTPLKRARLPVPPLSHIGLLTSNGYIIHISEKKSIAFLKKVSSIFRIFKMKHRPFFCGRCQLKSKALKNQKKHAKRYRCGG